MTITKNQVVKIARFNLDLAAYSLQWAEEHVKADEHLKELEDNTIKVGMGYFHCLSYVWGVDVGASIEKHEEMCKQEWHTGHPEQVFNRVKEERETVIAEVGELQQFFYENDRGVFKKLNDSILVWNKIQIQLDEVYKLMKLLNQ